MMGSSHPTARGASWARLAALLVASGCLALGCTDAGPGPEADSGPDAGPDVDAGLVDAETPVREASVEDAQVRPDARVFSFCGEAMFKMPFSAQENYLREREIEGAQVFYSIRQLYGQIYRFDLDLCEEQQLTLGGSAMYFGVMGDVLVYDRYGADDPLCRDLDVVFQSDLSIVPLFQTSSCEYRPRTNGRFVSYMWQPDSDSPGNLRLYDRQLGTAIDLMPPHSYIKSPTMSDRYVAWTAIQPTPWSEGSDVFVHDLATGDTTQLEASYEKWQDWVFVWEDYVTWSGAEGDLVPPYHLVLYHLGTGDKVMLLEGDYAVGTGHIREGLVVYNTSRYTGTTDLVPSDMEIYDIETQVRRRLSVEPGYLRASRIDPPYLLVTLVHGEALRDDLYVANLEMLGVLDTDGRVIPGDGVIVLPP